MTTKKILEYLEAELERYMHVAPVREEYVEDYIYDLDTASWDAKVCLLDYLIDNIKNYDNDKEYRKWTNNLIKKYRKKDED